MPPLQSIPNHHKYARELLEAADSNHDGRLDFSEFEAYMNQKELELLELFREVDVERDGKLFPWEIKAALQKAGAPLASVGLLEIAQDRALRALDLWALPLSDILLAKRRLRRTLLLASR